MKPRVFHGFLKNAGCTPRETDVMMLLFYGETDETISDKFRLPVETIKRYRRRAAVKLRGLSGFCDYTIGDKDFEPSDPRSTARISPSDPKRPSEDRS